MNHSALPMTALVLVFINAAFSRAEEGIHFNGKKDIRKLSQHFTNPHDEMAPWVFLPEENIASISTAEHAGVVTIWEAGRGKDIKGLLEQPIGVDDYPLPWEFHLGFIQNYQAMKGISEKQINYAIGLNI